MPREYETVVPRAGSTRAQPRQSGRGRDASAILRLQRALGNRNTRALLRSPRDTEPEFAALSSASTKGGLDAEAWKQKVIAAKQAVRQQKLDEATSLYVELYQDLARTAGAEVVPDVSPKYPINIAGGNDTGYKPGLNLVVGSGGRSADRSRRRQPSCRLPRARQGRSGCRG